MLKFLCTVLLLLRAFYLDAEEVFLEKLVAESVKHYQAAHGVPGVALFLFYKGEPHFYAYGLADVRRGRRVTEETIFELGSITKSFTAILFAAEAIKGNLNINDLAKSYLPGFNTFNGPFSEVTLKQLATHTSQLPHHMPYKDRLNYLKIVDYLKSWQPDKAIGSQHQYSNLGFGLLALCIENATHKKYMELLKEDILLPLRMNHTYLKVPLSEIKNYAQGYTKEGRRAEEWPLTLFFGAGALRSNAKDMGKLLAACLNLSTPPESVRKAIELTEGDGFKISKNRTQVFSWIKRKEASYTLFAKNGGVSGFSTFMGYIPELKTGIVILANKNASNTALGLSILQKLAAKALE